MASFQFSLLLLVLLTWGAYQSSSSPVCTRLSSSDLKNLQVCNLTGYSTTTYFWDTENCLRVDQQLVTLIQTFSDDFWKNQVAYPESCLEEYVRFSCSQACPICRLPSYVTPPSKTSELDGVYQAMGTGVGACTDRCQAFVKACNNTPGLSKLSAHSNCTVVTQNVVSSQSAASIDAKQIGPTCTNHKSTLISENPDISSPEALGYATCDAGFLKTIKPQICTATNLEQMIWNDRAGDDGESTCEQKDDALAEVLPQFVETFNTYNICVEDYQDCLDAYSNFVCSMSCPFCKNNQSYSLPCKSQCEAIVTACSGLPVLGITARMNCSRYSADSCTSLTAQGVSTIIEDNASEESIECPSKNGTNTTTTSRSIDDLLTVESSEALIHSLLNYRSESHFEKQSRREVPAQKPQCETINEYITRTENTNTTFGVCLVDPKQKLSSASECLLMDSRLNSLLQSFSEFQALDRSERPSQLSCLDAYSSFLCSYACRPCSSDGACYESCAEFKSQCEYWPASNSMQLSAPGIPSAFMSEFWTGDPFYTIQNQFDCGYFKTINSSSCSFVQNSLGSFGWISDVTHIISKSTVILGWDLNFNTRTTNEADVRVNVELVSTTAPLEQWKKGTELPVTVARDLRTNKLKFRAPKGKHTFSISAYRVSSSSSAPRQSPISTEVVIEL